jgi:hypothetical protein
MILRSTAITIFVCFVSLQACAQKHGDVVNKFYKSVIDASIVTARPIATTIKIDVSRTGRIGMAELADSTDWAFRKVFFYKIKDLDWAALQKFVKLNGWKNISLFIPYYVYNASEGENKQKGNLMIQFNGKSFSGKNILLKPIEIYYLSEF